MIFPILIHSNVMFCHDFVCFFKIGKIMVWIKILANVTISHIDNTPMITVKREKKTKKLT